MKILVVYDSMYGNTEKIAKAIAGGLSGEVITKKAVEATAADLPRGGLLVIGSPIQAGHPLKTTQSLLDSIYEADVKGLKVAAFDTRVTGGFAKLFGWAAKRIADNLKKKGAELIVEPEGFFVKGKEGPLLEGELERAASWGKIVLAAAQSKEAVTSSR
jgi:flavodoxin